MGRSRNSRPRRGSRPGAVLFASESATATMARTSEIVAEVMTEARRGGVAASTDATEMPVHYIRAGWSLNGRYYPADVLRTEGVAAAVPGTLLYIDHPTEDEDMARPAGTITRLAAVQVGPAWWDEDAQAVAATVKLFRPWREALNDMRDTIGLSVRAWVTAEQGEAEGRRGPVVTGIEGYKSVDFVTVPAAGGKILSVAEALGATADEARNAGAWFESRIHADFTLLADRMYGEGYLTRAERITLSGAIGDALAAWTARVEADAPHLFERDPYREPEAASTAAQEDGAAQAPAAVQEGLTNMGATNEPTAAAVTEGATPGQLTAEARAQIAEQELERTRLAAEQATEANRQAAAHLARANAAEAEVRRMRATEAARAEVGRQIGAITGQPAALLALIRPRVEEAAALRVPLVAEGEGAGQVDAAGLTATVAAAIEAERTYAAQILEAHGVGDPSGFGGSGEGGSGLTDEALQAEMEDTFKALGMDEKAAAIAAKGRI